MDDDEERHARFVRAHVGHVITQVRDVWQAKRALETAEPYDFACLDHDLGGQQMVESGNASGYAVAEYIAEMPAEKRPRRVIVHSFNPVGVQNMVRVLKDAGVSTIKAPFGTFRIGA